MSLVLEFVSCVVKNLVNVPEDVMSGWVQNPMALQKALTTALCPPKWTERDGVIYFKLASDGTTGPDWIGRLEKKGFRLSKWAKDILNSSDFKPTQKGTIHQIAVIRGASFSDGDRITEKIRKEAERRDFSSPNPEVVCLIREVFSDEELEEMGLWWIVVFHEPIKDSVGSPRLLRAGRGTDGRWLDATYGRSGDSWDSDGGFAFLVSQTPPN